MVPYDTDRPRTPAVAETPSQAPGPRKLSGFLRTGYLVHDVSRLRRLFYDQQSRHLGITRSQWWVLFNLARHDGEPLNQNELAQMIEVGSSSVGELILKLEKSGFVKRVVDTRDRRAKRVEIAARGREVLEHMRLVARDNHAPIMAGISPEEQTVLNDLLLRMKSNLAELLADAPEERDTDDIAAARDPQPGRLSVSSPSSATMRTRLRLVKPERGRPAAVCDES